MNRSRALHLAMVLSLTSVVAACSEGPTQPEQGPDFAATPALTGAGTCPTGYDLLWTGRNFAGNGNNPGYQIDKNRNGYVCRESNPTGKNAKQYYVDDA